MQCGLTLYLPSEIDSIDYSKPKSYTPKFIVDKILTSRGSIEGERKLVTVFFADVADFSSISTKLDPEEVHQIMNGTFKIMLDEIHKFEGTINQFTGDGVMALFGAPIAHEDHARRACYAALAIQESIKSYSNHIKNLYGFDFALRIGLNSGTVVVGSIGDDLRMDYTAVGEATNLASRMESSATPGTTFLAKSTYRLARDFFEFESIGKIEMKGKIEPQEAFKLIRADEAGPRIGASVSKGLTRFVGRRHSMAGLTDIYKQVLAGSGHVVGVVGEAGVGKSRILLEHINSLPQEEFIYLEGRSLNYGSSIAYLPILEILKSYFEIKDGDQEPIIKEKIKAKVIKLNEKLRYIIFPFQELLSLKVDSEKFSKLEPEQKREKTFEAIRDLFVRLSQEKTIILAIEDLHWIDKTSEEFLNYLIRWLPNSRILLILLYRPEYTHQWGSISYYNKIGLTQLGISSSTQLILAILEKGEVAPEILELILNRASGNPLFIEELTYTLLENGSIDERDNKYILNPRAYDIEVPDTIQGLIAARLDRLDSNSKRTLQVASVIGRDFAFRILQTITRIHEELKSYLLDLQGLEFIYEKSLFPELEYTFKHALTQEVTYYSLLTTRRKELHSKVGQAMEQIFADRLSELSSIIGEHYLRGEVWDRAFQYLDKAGDAAARLFAHAEARMHFARALKVLTRLKITEDNRRRRVDTTIKLAHSSWRASSPEENLKRLAEAEKLVTALIAIEEASDDDNLRLARVRFWMGRVLYSMGLMNEALQYFRQVLPVAQVSGDPELLSIPSGAIGQAMAVLGHLYKARDLLGQAIPLLEKTANWAEWIQAMSFRGAAMGGAGDYTAGVNQVQFAHTRAKELNFITGISVSCNCLGFAHFFCGNLLKAMEAGQEAVAAAEQSGDRIYEYVGYGIWGWAAGRAGRIETADDCMARSQKVAQELGGRVVMADLFTSARGEIALVSGYLDKALELAQKGVAISQEVGGVLAEGIARRVWAQTLTAQPSPQWNEAEAQLTESLRVLELGPSRPEAARTRLVWGSLCHSRGDVASARKHWEKAAALFESCDIAKELENVRRLLAAL
jgi:class 3 adenylate cyclase/tetratricopeptide (TPR) repeat protein